VHAPSEEKSDDSNYSFDEELEQVSIIFLSTILDPVRRFSCKIQERKFSSQKLDKSLHKDSDDNGVRRVNFDVSKNLIAMSTMFLHRNIHKHT
jgi:hypothetical protein